MSLRIIIPVIIALYSFGVSARSNAVDSLKRVLQTHASISTKRLDDMVEMRIEDNGPGIPVSIKEKIFQPFFTAKPTGQGNGLGLSLSYDIIKAHRRTLEVNSLPASPSRSPLRQSKAGRAGKEARPDDSVGRGEGSEFIIQLPT